MEDLRNIQYTIKMTADSKDPLLKEAAQLIVNNQIAKTSLLQRKLLLGFDRACRIMNQLEAFGIVDANDGSNERNVLVKTEAELNLLLKNLQS